MRQSTLLYGAMCVTSSTVRMCFDYKCTHSTLRKQEQMPNIKEPPTVKDRNA
jgi:hypothetical protein